MIECMAINNISRHNDRFRIAKNAISFYTARHEIVVYFVFMTSSVII